MKMNFHVYRSSILLNLVPETSWKDIYKERKCVSLIPNIHLFLMLINQFFNPLEHACKFA